MKICLVWGIVYGGEGDSPKGDKMPNDVLFRIGNRRFPYVLCENVRYGAKRHLFSTRSALSAWESRGGGRCDHWRRLIYVWDGEEATESAVPLLLQEKEESTQLFFLLFPKCFLPLPPPHLAKRIGGEIEPPPFDWTICGRVGDVAKRRYSSEGFFTLFYKGELYTE